MFGYVKTDTPNMYVKDTVLYKAMYCGLCKGIGKTCGLKGRFVLNYDLTFLSVLVHNVLGVDVNVKKQRCIMHAITKKPMAEFDNLTGRVAALNVILAYYKVCDDVIDSKKGKFAKSLLKSAYKKAKTAEIELDQIVNSRYEQLRKMEKANSDSIDVVADAFASMLVDIVRVLTCDCFSEPLSNVAYNLGKWIYLIDALDDFDKDIKKCEYNVFVNAYPNAKNKQELIERNRQDIACVFGQILAEIEQNTSMISYKFNHDLTDNVLLRGLKEQTKQIMENKKCKKTTKS